MRVARLDGRRGPRPALAALTLSLALTVNACASGPGALRVDGVAQPTGADRSACERLAGTLPRSLGHGLGRRSITPATTFAAAWGNPPVVLSCGVTGVAPSYQPTSALAVVDGVGWFAEQLDQSVRYSTPTRRPQVVVLVPGGRDSFDVLTSLAQTVGADTRSTSP
ncbi:MAG: DUF3515 family protein [Frankia sp.]